MTPPNKPVPNLNLLRLLVTGSLAGGWLVGAVGVGWASIYGFTPMTVVLTLLTCSLWGLGYACHRQVQAALEEE
jgi:hypothetical protein